MKLSLPLFLLALATPRVASSGLRDKGRNLEDIVADKKAVDPDPANLDFASASLETIFPEGTGKSKKNSVGISDTGLSLGLGQPLDNGQFGDETKVEACSSCKGLLPTTFYDLTSTGGFINQAFPGANVTGRLYPGLSAEEVDPILFFASFISELIYSSDVLSCLLMSFVKTANNLVCKLQDFAPDPKVRQDFASYPTATLMQELGCKGKNAMSCAIQTLGISSDMMQAHAQALLVQGNLHPKATAFLTSIVSGNSVDKDGIEADSKSKKKSGDFIDKIFVQYLNQENLNAVRGATFFGGCTAAFALSSSPEDLEEATGICLVLYTAVKTLDAVTCKYREAGCSLDNTSQASKKKSKGADVCGADLKAQTEYEARRLALDTAPLAAFFGNTIFPRPGEALGAVGFLLADIAAPCTVCALSENICSGYCNYFDGFDKCDPLKKSFVNEVLL